MLQKVESRIRIMSDLRELASAESLDAFTLVYSNILEHQPDCPVNNIKLTKAYSFDFAKNNLFSIYISSNKSICRPRLWRNLLDCVKAYHERTQKR